MIRINLLPRALRKKEGMPLPQFLAVLGALALFGFVFYMVTKYEFDVIPNLVAKRDNLKRYRTTLLAQVDELRTINAEIARLTEYVETVRTLYRNRVIWAKILSNFKTIIDRDPTMNEYNPGMRYLWMTKFTGKDKSISLDGYATDVNSTVAMQMPSRFIRDILTYSPTTMPEKDEEIRLTEELRGMTVRYEALRRENPDLPPQNPAETLVRERLEEIRKIKSGGLALQPLHEQLVPGSLQLNSASWVAAPQVKTGDRGAELAEVFPKEAWSFKLSMTLK